MFYNEESKIRIANDRWTLLVFKDLYSVEQTIEHNSKILATIMDTFNEDSPRLTSFKAEIVTHISLLGQISDSISLKFKEIFAGTRRYTKRQKRGLINGIGAIWKSITGNLDASDGEYFNNCINKVVKDEREIETLLKNQISVTTSVIKSFNNTIQKLKIDEETFNTDMVNIHKMVSNISDNLAFYQAQIKILEICESLMESYLFIKNTIDDILNAISFARLKILHNTIITPDDLISSLNEISRSLKRNNLPLPTYAVAQYLDIIELEAFQIDTKVVFVLTIPLVDPDIYTLYKLYPIPVLDNRTGLHHMLTSNQKFIAKNDDSLLYLSLRNMDNCKPLETNIQICSNIVAYPIDSDAICEAQLLRQTNQLPKTCKSSYFFAKDYNVYEIKNNVWLIAISESLPITIKCESTDPTTKFIQTNSILQLQPGCNAFVGSTRIHSKTSKSLTVTYKHHPINIPYNCCHQYPEKLKIPELKPLKLNKFDIEDLSIAQHKLDQYSEQLDKLMNEPTIYKYTPWFTILSIIVTISAIVLYIFYRCKKRRTHPRTPMANINTRSDNDDFPSGGTIQERIRRALPRRRPSIYPNEPREEINVLQTDL